MDEDLRGELLSMAAEDSRVRDELDADGSLYEGYHPRMEAVHRKNAARLREIMERSGWPGRALAGEDGAEAAWLVVQHAISEPSFQRLALELIRVAAARCEAPAWQAAMLEDRIRAFEGRPQIYGTQFDWREDGELGPYPDVEEPERVDELRRSVGLGPLGEQTERMRAAVKESNEKPPQDLAARRRGMDEWARRVGWR